MNAKYNTGIHLLMPGISVIRGMLTFYSQSISWQHEASCWLPYSKVLHKAEVTVQYIKSDIAASRPFSLMSVFPA